MRAKRMDGWVLLDRDTHAPGWMDTTWSTSLMDTAGSCSVLSAAMIDVSDASSTFPSWSMQKTSTMSFHADLPFSMLRSDISTTRDLAAQQHMQTW